MTEMEQFADSNNPSTPDHIGHREYDVEGNKVLQSDERDTLRSISLCECVCGGPIDCPLSLDPSTCGDKCIPE